MIYLGHYVRIYDTYRIRALYRFRYRVRYSQQYVILNFLNKIYDIGIVSSDTII
jgi:hypothetical protein